MAEVYGHKFHTKRISTNIDAFQNIAENEELSKKDLRVFIFLCCRLESEHYKKIDKKQVAETLNLSKKDIDKCVDNLLDQGILAQGSDEHVRNGYILCYADKNNVSKIGSLVRVDIEE
jgi:predicted transcriptional regulator